MARLQAPPLLSQRWKIDLGEHVQSLVWSRDTSRVAAALVGGPIFVVDAADGKVVHSLAGHGFGTADLSLDPEGEILASAGQDGKIALWDVKTGEKRAVLEAGAAWAEKVAWSPNGKFLASGAGKKLRLWDRAGAAVQQYPDRPSTVTDIRWHPKGKEFACAAYGGVSFWSPESAEAVRTFEWQGSLLAVAWSPDGRTIAGGAQDASVHFWYVRSGKDLEMGGYPLKVSNLAWSPDSRLLATGGSSDVTVWDCSGRGPADTEPISLDAHERPVTALAWQNRGEIAVSGCAGGRVVLWKPGALTKPLARTELDSGVSQLAWSATDGRFAVGTEGGTVACYTI